MPPVRTSERYALLALKVRVAHQFHLHHWSSPTGVDSGAVQQRDSVRHVPQDNECMSVRPYRIYLTAFTLPHLAYRI